RLEAPLRSYAAAHPRRAILVVISDLYEEPDVVLEALHALRGRGSDIVMWHVLDPAEIDFPFRDAASFQDMEGDEAVPAVPDQLREQYRAMVAEHAATLARRIGAAGMDYQLFDTRRPLGDALHSYLATRERLLDRRGAPRGRG
ncbi:MAG: DUF58 domain-containing protein, partial [Gemmatimonadaceae bacterium]